MRTIDLCRYVEEQGMEAVKPLLRSLAEGGQFTIVNKGPLAEILQATVGDAVLNRNGQIWSVELKTEQVFTGNFFLEFWSNKNFLPRKLGWMATLSADVLWEYFLDTDSLYSISFRKLWEWAFVRNRIYAFPEKEQRKNIQLNRTFGRCVPVKVIKAEVGYKLYHPGQSYQPVEEEEVQIEFELGPAERKSAAFEEYLKWQARRKAAGE